MTGELGSVHITIHTGTLDLGLITVTGWNSAAVTITLLSLGSTSLQSRGTFLFWELMTDVYHHSPERSIVSVVTTNINCIHIHAGPHTDASYTQQPFPALGGLLIFLRNSFVCTLLAEWIYLMLIEQMVSWNFINVEFDNDRSLCSNSIHRGVYISADIPN